MKKNNFLVIVVVLLIQTFTLQAKSGLTASFKTGFPLNGTSIGIKLGPFAVYGGLDIASISASFDDSYTSWQTEYLGWNPSTYQYEYGDLYKEYEEESTFDGSASLFIPQLGAKLYVWNVYFLSELMFVIPSIEAKVKGERRWYNPDGTISEIDKWSDDLEDEDKKTIEDALNFWGLSLGFGVEYPLSKNFSIGGEYGLRIFFNDITDEGSDIDDYNDPPRWKDQWEDKVSMSLGITYTRFSLNYIL